MRLTRSDCCLAALLVLITWAVFWDVQEFEFVNYDDDVFSSENVYVASGISWKSVRWAFSAESSKPTANWIPVTWLSLMLDGQLYGMDAGGFHRTSLLLHTVNVLLLYSALMQLTGDRPRCALVAALFAVHPLNVETVAWVSERKGLLSAFFGLISIWAYARYARYAGAVSYLAALVAFCLSLMSKQMLVTLPFLFLLLDYWPLCRTPLKNSGIPLPSAVAGSERRTWRQLFREKVPFFLVSAVFCIVAVEAQRRGGAVQSLESIRLATRCANAAVAYLLYMVRMVWPVNLAAHYPHPGDSIPLILAIGAVACLGLITLAALVLRIRRPSLIVGWLWFVGTLIPVSGLVQTGLHQMADRYAYLSLIGLFIAVTWLIPSWLPARHPDSRFLPLAAIIAVLLLAVVSWVQLGYWQNSMALFERALAVTRNNKVAHNNLGLALRDSGFSDEAIQHFRQAIEIDPDYAPAHNNLGLALRDRGLFSEAMDHFEQALETEPQYVTARVNLGIALCMSGDRHGGAEQFRQALKDDPEDLRAHLCLAWTLPRLGEMEQARKHAERARAIQRRWALAPRDLPMENSAVP